MKKTKYVGLSLVAMTLLGGANVASAEKILNGNDNDKTPTKIEIKAATGTDDLDPKSPFQQSLVLTHTPDAYNFESAVKNGSYNLTTNVTDNVTVFNDRTDRDWSVVAEVTDAKLIANDAAKTEFAVKNFKIDGVALSNTGGDGIISRSEAIKTDANNVGDIKKDISKIDIQFEDTNRVIKNGTTLKGEIKYTLHNTPDGQ